MRQFLICYQVASFQIQVKPLSCHTSKGKVGHTLWWVSSLYHYNFHYDHQQHCNLALPINNCKITKKWNPRKHSWLFDVRDESADERKKSSTLPGCLHFHNHFDIIVILMVIVVPPFSLSLFWQHNCPETPMLVDKMSVDASLSIWVSGHAWRDLCCWPRLHQNSRANAVRDEQVSKITKAWPNFQSWKF